MSFSFLRNTQDQRVWSRVLPAAATVLRPWFDGGSMAYLPRTCLVPVSYLPCGSRSTWEVRDRYETGTSQVHGRCTVAVWSQTGTAMGGAIGFYHVTSTTPGHPRHALAIPTSPDVGLRSHFVATSARLGTNASEPRTPPDRYVGAGAGWVRASGPLSRNQARVTCSTL
jgi:hypothetical protein